MSTTKQATTPSELAGELRLALGALMRRVRQERGLGVHHAAVLARLEREGPSFISELAASEGVRPQSMAQTVAELEAKGLVTRSPDPSDRRRTTLRLTAAGRRALAAERQRKEDWLATALELLSPSERALLARALPLLSRLVGVDQRDRRR